MSRAVEMGEELVGAWLSQCEKCDIVSYNQRHPIGQGEIDVLAFKMAEKRVFICQVTTHLDGMLYSSGRKKSVSDVLGRSYHETVATQSAKWDRDIRYATDCLSGFKAELMLWTPKASKTHILQPLTALSADLIKKHSVNIQIIANDEYAHRIAELQHCARKTSKLTGNSAFRLLQILSRVKPVLT